MTTTRRRQPSRRPGAPRSSLRGQFTSDRQTPPASSWWVRVERAAWRAAVTAHERRWRRTETSTPTPGV